MSHAYYLGDLFNDVARKETIKRAKDKLKGRKFNGFIVVNSASGMIGAILAHELKKKLVIVRKKYERTHSSYRVENLSYLDHLIFVDDLIDTGDTLRHCIETARKQALFRLEGAYLYNENDFIQSKELKQRFNIGV